MIAIKLLVYGSFFFNYAVPNNQNNTSDLYKSYKRFGYLDILIN